MDAAIQIEGLCKDYRIGFWGRRQCVLRDLSLEVRAGEAFGYLGPNGAGKSTTIKLLLGLIHTTGGAGRVLDRPLGDPSVRGRIGFLPENPSFYEYLTGQEFLTYCGRLLDVRRTLLRDQVAALLTEVGLSAAAGQQIRKYSKGMVQRLGLAQALLGDPRLLILDEPMSGLDPIGRKEVRDLLLRQRAAGRTIFFSTHILPDVEMICDRVGILVGGRLMKAGPIHTLLGGEVESIELTVTALPPAPFAALQRLAVSPALEQEGRIMFRLPHESALDSALAVLTEAKVRVVSIIPQRRSLEDIFLEANREANA